MKKTLIGFILLAVLLAIVGMAGAETAITPNTATTVDITIPGEVAIYEYTPTADGIYRFYSGPVAENQYMDTYGYLLDEDYQLITSNDDGYGRGQFQITKKLNANQKYYFATRFFGSLTIGSYVIRVDRIEGIFAEAKESTVYIASGKSGTLEVTALSPNGELSYQWYDGNTAIAGAMGYKYTVSGLTAAKTYRCVVTDTAGQSATVTIEAKIDSEMRLSLTGDTEVDYNGSTTLTVNATVKHGAEQLTYQWFKESMNADGVWHTEEIAGANGPSLALNNITTMQYYFCEVTDYNGVTKSQSTPVRIKDAQLTLKTSGDGNIEVNAGESATLTVTATSTYPISYQWYRVSYVADSERRDAIDGATDPSLTLNNISASGTYSCMVTNTAGYSNQCYFNVTAKNVFNASATDGNDEISISTEQSATMGVTVTSVAGGVTYQWYRYYDAFEQYIPIKGATNATYASEKGRSGSYYCWVQDAAGNSENVNFGVTVNSEFSAKADSSTELTLMPNATADLKVLASSSGRIIYRWYRRPLSTDSREENEVLIDGAQTDTLSITAEGRAEYRCRVSDQYGNSETIYFSVRIENGFSVNATQTSFTVEPGENVTLTVTGKCTNGEIIYRWQRFVRNYGYMTVQESTDNSLVIESIGKDNYGEYNLYAYDSYGNNRSFYFRISIENGLTAEADGDSVLTVEPGDDLELKVNADCDDGDITFEWYQRVDRENGWYYDRMSNETQSILQLTNIQKANQYECIVSDDYGGRVYVLFTVRIDNELTVRAKEGKTWFEVDPEAQVAFEAIASSKRNGPLTYQWYKHTRHDEDGYTYWSNDLIADATEATYSFKADKAGDYICYVSDEYGNRINIWFYLRIKNELRIWAVDGEDHIVVASGETATMTAEASCKNGTMTFEWRRSIKHTEDGNTYWNEEVIDGATGLNYTTGPVTNAEEYVCYAYDMYGNSYGVWFYIQIDNELTVAPVGTRYKRASIGDDVTMAVDASCRDGELTYRWTKLTRVENEYGESWNEYIDIEGANGESYTAEKISEKGEYRCYVKDVYGNEEEVYFSISIDNGLTASAKNSYYSLTIPFGGTATMTVEASCNNGGLTYQWYKQVYHPDGEYWSETEKINGATGTSYTEEMVSEYRTDYYCNVYDEYGNNTNVWFYVYGDTELTATANGSSVFPVSEEPITMRVTASNRVDGAGIRYQWYENSNIIDGATSSSYTVANPTEDSYYCTVSDYGNKRREVRFYITEQEAFATGSGSGAYKPGDQVQFKVDAWNAQGDITYQWYDKDRNLIEGATSASYSFIAENSVSMYCTVAGTGIKREIHFYINIYGSWHYSTKNLSRIYVIQPGAVIDIAMDIMSEYDDAPTYSWTRDGEVIEGATGKTLAVANGGQYSFFALDKFGNNFSIGPIYCIEGQAEAVVEGSTVTGPENGGCSVYQFTPGETGIYKVEAEGYYDVYTQGRWDYEIYLNDTNKSARLEKGRTYYVILDSQSDSFKYTLVRDETTPYPITLQKGQTLRLPSVYVNNQYCYLEYASSSNTKVVSIRDSRMTVLAEGTATVTAHYDHDVVKKYDITVVSGNTLELPEMLETIEEDAFNGDTGFILVKLGNNVETVKRGAFANAGTINVVVTSYNTYFEDGVFSGSNPVVLCRDGGYLPSYCRDRDIPYFFTD